MIVLHGTWKPPEKKGEKGSFFIWGESSSPPLLQTKRGRKTKIIQRPHPFQADEKELLPILRSINPSTGESLTKKAQPDSIMLSLPSYPDAPQASPDLLCDSNGTGTDDRIAIALWMINGISIPLEFVLQLLNSVSEAWIDENFVTGTDIRYWSKVSKFAMELLSKQRFVPGVIVSENNESFARWEYVAEEQDDRTRISMLKLSMPPVCRAFEVMYSLDALLSDFLNSAIDSSIRSWITIEEIRSKKPGLSEAWLRSLATGEPIVSTGAIDRKVSEWIMSWNAPIHEIEKSEFRLCFRLEPPLTEDSTWDLRYLLQATDDLSLLVPAANVWQESRDILEFLNRKFDHPQEKLLADLGKATGLFPPIEESLNSARPDAAELTTQQAYSFLKEAAPLLTESGFGVLVPPWWSKGAANVKLGVKLNMTPKSDAKAGRGVFSFNSIIKYNWQLSLGGEPISEEEFNNLVNLKEPLVQIRGQWVEIKKEDIAAAIKYFKSKQYGEMKLGEAMRLGMGLADSETGLPVTGFSSKGWLSDLFERLSGKEDLKELAQPDDFVGKLRPYQIKGFSWLSFLRTYSLGACLADDMGLGKTIQFLALLLKDKTEGVSQPTLLICPTSVVGNWQREAAKFAPSLGVMVHHGMKRKKENEFLQEVSKHDLVISTYALVHRDAEMLQQVEWNGVALDEAQNIKNQFTKQSQAVRKLNSNYRVALTGTPVENRLSELWSIMEFLNPGYLGSSDSFRRNFALPIERYNNNNATARLRTIVSPFIMRRLKTDPAIIKDLPDKIEIRDRCNLTKEQATLYEAIVKDMLKKIEDASGINRKGLVLSALMRLKQVCNHPALFLRDGSALPGRSGKLNRITDMMEEVLSEGDSALVFTQFAEMGGMLKTHFQKVFGHEVLFLHGGIPQKQRDQMVMRFSEKSGPRIFILSLKAGGVGLNLTRANHVFHFDRWWNPAVENQATDRAFRIGQTKNVQVHKFICEGTLEEKIDDMIEKKKALAENIIGAGEGWLTEMSTDQLRDLFTLRKEAIADE